MRNSILCLILLLGLLPDYANTYGQTNYLNYHESVIACEQYIADNKFEEALSSLELLFDQYDFVFLRDIKLATQLAVYLQDRGSVYKYIRRGFSSGWSLRAIKKEDYYTTIKTEDEWQNLISEYDSIRNRYMSSLNQELRDQVHAMFKKDQRKAFGALLRIGQKSQDRYAENKFAPHSEQQLAELRSILIEYGYPGEQLIGNDWWASTILGHHNSISMEYVSKDTLYTALRPKLLKALEKGELSPFEFALMEDWRTAVVSNHKLSSYGFLGAIPDEQALRKVNANRLKIGLRSIELRNKLVDIEAETGMNFYLPGGSWQKGKITISGI